MKIGLQRKGLLGAAALLLAGASAIALMGASEAPKKTYRIGVIAKSQSNPVFQAARTGALDAGEDLSKKLGADVKVEWRTPVNEDAQQQAQYVEQLASQGFDGIAISASDANVLTAAVNSAIDRGVVVITFDSDIPASKRLAYYGINDEEAGRSVMRELAKSMGGKGGKIAILSGNQNATNLNARVKGVKDELATLKDKGFTLKDVYYTKETASDAAALVQQVQTANPDIVGWAMVGGWPLFTQNALDGVYEKAKIVSVDHLPEQLNYVKNGQVAALIGQDCYGWGYQSVVMLVDKLNSNKNPEKVINNFPLSVVTKDNVAQYEGLWNKWLKKK
ncbi:MAG: substrate-binding domain-containing protein [Phycisphaerales bacterium]